MKESFTITGIILAGGNSNRMGCDKAFLKLGSRTIIEELISRLKKKFTNLIIVVNDIRKYVNFVTSTSCFDFAQHPSKHPELVEGLNTNPGRNRKINIKVVSDIIPGKGPLGGIYTGLIISNSFYNFVFACDAAFVNLDLIEHMLDRAKGIDILVPKWKGKFEPLHAIYSQKCIRPIENQIKDNNLKITNFFSQVSTAVIEQKELEKFNPDSPLFPNINTKEDYTALLEMGR